MAISQGISSREVHPLIRERQLHIEEEWPMTQLEMSCGSWCETVTTA